MLIRIELFLLFLLGLPLAGCSLLGMGVEVETVKTSAKPPSDISIYLSVKNEGEPVSYLTASEFRIYENDVLLDNSQIGLRLLSRDTFASGATIVVLDLSDNPTDEELHRISRGTAHFVEKVSTTQGVIVIAFDGSEKPRKIAEFSRVAQETKRPLPDLKPFLSKDTSRDLNSALIFATLGLKQTLSQQKSEVQFGTIVTLVRGRDLAGRKTEQEMQDALRRSGYELYSISPTTADVPSLGEIGADGRIEYDTFESLPLRFQDLGMQVRAAWYGHYLLTYCSPARAGTRQVEVQIKFDGKDGTPQSGSSVSEFESTGFKGGCVAKNASDRSTPVLPPIAPSELQKDPTLDQKPTADQDPPPPPPTPTTNRPKRVTPKKAPETPRPDDAAPVVAPPSSGKYE